MDYINNNGEKIGSLTNADLLVHKHGLVWVSRAALRDYSPPLVCCDTGVKASILA
jgi:hypothetical protein